MNNVRRYQKHKKIVKSSLDLDLKKWYSNGRDIFRFIEDTTEGYLRGKIKVDVQWNYRTEVYIPVLLISGGTLSLKTSAHTGGYFLGNHNIYEFDVNHYIKEEETKVAEKKAEYEKALARLEKIKQSIKEQPAI